MKDIIKELGIYGKVQQCEIIDDKAHIKITSDFTWKAIDTFSCMGAIISHFKEYRHILKMITDVNLFHLIIKR